MSLKSRLSRSELTIGSWVTLGHPSIAEIMASAGFDWLVLDMEHSVLELGEVQAIIQVLDAKQCPADAMISAIGGMPPQRLTLFFIVTIGQLLSQTTDHFDAPHIARQHQHL